MNKFQLTISLVFEIWVTLYRHVCLLLSCLPLLYLHPDKVFITRFWMRFLDCRSFGNVVELVWSKPSIGIVKAGVDLLGLCA